MKDAGFPLAIACSHLLANLTYEGRAVGVYSLQAPEEAVAPYVIIGAWQGNPGNTKNSFGQQGEISLDVVTRHSSAAISKKPASDICDLITTLITPRPGETGLVIPGFRPDVVRIGRVMDMPKTSSTDTIIRKIITLQLTLTQH